MYKFHVFIIYIYYKLYLFNMISKIEKDLMNINTLLCKIVKNAMKSKRTGHMLMIYIDIFVLNI